MHPSILSIEYLLPHVFTPACPVVTRQLLQGRAQLLEDIRSACVRVGASVILHGPRGVGKTSIARAMLDEFDGHAFYYSASAWDGFDSIASAMLAFFREARELEEVGDEALVAEIVPDPRAAADEHADRPGIHRTADEVAKRVPRRSILIVVDDFERIERPGERFAFADLIKKLSDNCADTTLMCVGIGGTAAELIGAHESVLRNLLAVQVPPLAPQQIRELLERGAATLGVQFEPEAAERIVQLATEAPDQAHLLGEAAVRSLVADIRAGRAGEPVITREDVERSIAYAARTNQLRARPSVETQDVSSGSWERS